MEFKSLDAVTVTDICNAADVNRGTFYKYYRDVCDLFEKTEDDFIEEIHAFFSLPRAPERIWSTFSGRNPSFYRNILWETV